MTWPLVFLYVCLTLSLIMREQSDENIFKSKKKDKKTNIGILPSMGISCYGKAISLDVKF